MQLLERTHELEVLGAAVRQVAGGGAGLGIAVAGESGAGKSALVAAALDGTSVRTLRGQCEPLRTPRPLGPFRDLGLVDLGGASEDEALQGEQVLAALGTEPTVLVVEDLHWLDAASADLLRFLVRRVETLPLLVLVTYRDLEIDTHHPARRLLGDFALLDGVETLALRPLSEDAVAEAVADTGLDAHRVHALTGGNPFFVTQVAREPDRPLPGSVRDAVLARIDDVDLDDLELLQLVATAPDRLDDRLLPLVGVDLPTLRRLDATTLITRDEHGLVFRHELARLAVESTVPPGGAAALHRRLLDALERIEPRDPAVLTHHAVAARDAARAAAYARTAAEEAVAAASHAEAASFLTTALAHLPSDTGPAERAGLLLQLSQQQYLTSQVAEAIDNARASIPLWERAGEVGGVAEAYATMAVLEYHAGRRRLCDEHIARACGFADQSGLPETVGRVHNDAAILAWCASDLSSIRTHAERVLVAAEQAGSVELEVAARMMLEAGPTAAGEPGARARLLDWSERAREGGWDEQAWRGMIMAVTADVQQANLRGAQRLVDTSLDHAVDQDLPLPRNWQLSVRGLVHLLSGRWQAALEDAESVRSDTGLGNILPHVVAGLARLRRGDEDAADHLETAWTGACGYDEPLRYCWALAGLAELEWMTGRRDDRVTGLDRVAGLGSPDCRWAAGDLAVWLRRLGRPVDVPPEVPEPYRAALAGRHVEAAEWWARAGNPFQEAMSYADSPDPEHRVRAVALLDQLGATGTADRLRAELRGAGLTAVPQRPRESTRANPGGLTNRQLDVARLVALGLSNQEIATRLFISPKTADHHVSAVLGKLGLPNRRAVVLQADSLGLA